MLAKGSLGENKPLKDLQAKMVEVTIIGIERCVFFSRGTTKVCHQLYIWCVMLTEPTPRSLVHEPASCRYISYWEENIIWPAQTSLSGDKSIIGIESASLFLAFTFSQYHIVKGVVHVVWSYMYTKPYSCWRVYSCSYYVVLKSFWKHYLSFAETSINAYVVIWLLKHDEACLKIAKQSTTEACIYS